MKSAKELKRLGSFVVGSHGVGGIYCSDDEFLEIVGLLVGDCGHDEIEEESDGTALSLCEDVEECVLDTERIREARMDRSLSGTS